MRILIVEDELILSQQIQGFFSSKGFAVDVANTASNGYYLATEYPIDVAIIDVGLPDFSGIELVARLRKDAINTPVLLLTARSRWQDKVEGLEAGADDYLAKPFHYEELLARVNALLRRSQGKAHPVLTYANIQLDSLSQNVRVDGETVELLRFNDGALEKRESRKL